MSKKWKVITESKRPFLSGLRKCDDDQVRVNLSVKGDHVQFTIGKLIMRRMGWKIGDKVSVVEAGNMIGLALNDAGHKLSPASGQAKRNRDLNGKLARAVCKMRPDGDLLELLDINAEQKDYLCDAPVSVDDGDVLVIKTN